MKYLYFCIVFIVLNLVAQENIKLEAQDGHDQVKGLSIRSLGTAASTGNDASETIASYTVQTPAILIATVINTKASAPDQPNVTGNGLVWTELFDTNYLTDHRLTVWYAKAGSGTIKGTFTADTGATAQTGWAINVTEIRGGVFTGVNGVDSFKQTANAQTISTNNTVTFATLGKRTLCVGFQGANLNSAVMAAESGWTKLVDSNFNTPPTEITIVYQIKNTDTTMTITNATAFTGVMFGMEFKQLGNDP